jgi:hypothetical protein
MFESRPIITTTTKTSIKVKPFLFFSIVSNPL